MARPHAPPSQATSTSTVGLPRLSSTSRAWMLVIASFTGSFLGKGGEFPFGAESDVVPAVQPVEEDGPSESPDRVALRLLGQVIDRAGSVDAGQQADAQVPHAAPLQFGHGSE